MEASRERAPSTAPAVAGPLAAAVSAVLGDDDLLREILLRLGFPTSLVCAALACKSWYRICADSDFLRRFRDLHPPRLLGFYISYAVYCHGRPDVDFVPVLPQPPELDAVLRRVNFSLDVDEGPCMIITGCRNGRVFISWLHPAEQKFTHGVHSPLHPARGLVIVPQLPTISLKKHCWDLRFKESVDGLSYVWLLTEYR